jgi:hypothetical protein
MPDGNLLSFRLLVLEQTPPVVLEKLLLVLVISLADILLFLFCNACGYQGIFQKVHSGGMG